MLKGKLADSDLIIRGLTRQEQELIQIQGKETSEQQEVKSPVPQTSSFTDFLRSGGEIRQVIPIDYTGSNGN